MELTGDQLDSFIQVLGILSHDIKMSENEKMMMLMMEEDKEEEEEEEKEEWDKKKIKTNAVFKRIFCSS